GGSLFNENAPAMLTDCSFLENTAGRDGGGLYSEDIGTTCTGCTFVSNDATRFGGGMLNSAGSHSDVTGCVFKENSAQDGAGMYNANANPTVSDCAFFGNDATGLGGGMYNGGSAPTIDACSFRENTASTGGGMHNHISSNPTISNSLFCKNDDVQLEGPYTDGGDNTITDSCDICGEQTGDRLGATIISLGDVTGDGLDDFAVGAPNNDENGTDSGKVYVYNGATGLLLWEKAGEAKRDKFGTALAAGDTNNDGINELIVGAPLHDKNKNNRGKIYVYNGLTGVKLFSRLGKNAGDSFGQALASGIDVNKDGRHDILVGAPKYDKPASNAGAVYVISGKNSQLKILTGEKKNDKFGSAVAGVGRINNDNRDDFIVGAPNRDAGGRKDSGRVYVYSAKKYKLLYTLNGKRAWDKFGSALAGVGRSDPGLKPFFVVGAPKFDSSKGKNSGRVYAFDSKNGTQLWAKNGPMEEALLGSSVADAGDLNCDGRSDVLIGAPGFSKEPIFFFKAVGVVYAHSGQNGARLETHMGEFRSEKFGSALAALGDIDGDQQIDFAIGSPHFNCDERFNAGIVQIVTSTTTCVESGAAPPKLAMDHDLEPDLEPLVESRSIDIAPRTSSSEEIPWPQDEGSFGLLRLANVLESWGSCAQADCPADLNYDGVVDINDLLTLLEDPDFLP
ncbi:MAG: integrin alpha, partial [Planctomycetota bacterium]|nr:integrin alpha [Planctomycetota bacterium]